MVLEDIPNVTENQAKFIEDMLSELTTYDSESDSYIEKIYKNKEKLSTRSASVCINYLRFRLSELKTGFKVVSLE